MSLTKHDHYDVIVAGARCAGASTAMLLARRGLRVLVVDPMPRGRDTLSTHALMRGGVVQLNRWGLLDAIRDAGTPAVQATTFDYGDEVITVPIKRRDGIDALYAPRRVVLDPILEDAATQAGAEVVRGLAVVDLVRDRGIRVKGAWLAGRNQSAKPVSADLVIGADGLRSKVARLANARIEHQSKYRTASIYGYWPGLTPGGYNWHFRPRASIGAIPTNNGETCIFASVPADDFTETRRAGLKSVHMRAVRSVDPELAEAIGRTGQRPRLRAFAGLPGFIRRSFGPGWALVGDAGYFRDPLTAHGITDALRDAELLARAVHRGTDGALRNYQLARDEVARGLMKVTDRIASLEWTMTEVKELHLRLSRMMNAGLDVVRGFCETESVTSGPIPNHAEQRHARLTA